MDPQVIPSAWDAHGVSECQEDSSCRTMTSKSLQQLPMPYLGLLNSARFLSLASLFCMTIIRGAASTSPLNTCEQVLLKPLRFSPVCINLRGFTLGRSFWFFKVRHIVCPLNHQGLLVGPGCTISAWHASACDCACASTFQRVAICGGWLDCRQCLHVFNTSAEPREHPIRHSALFIYLFIIPFIHLSIHLSIYPFIHLY